MRRQRSHTRSPPQFRKDLRAARAKLAKERLDAVEAELKASHLQPRNAAHVAQALSNADIEAKLAEVDSWRAAGVDDHELPDAALAVAAEAKARGIKAAHERRTGPLKFDTTVRFTR